MSTTATLSRAAFVLLFATAVTFAAKPKVAPARTFVDRAKFVPLRYSVVGWFRIAEAPFVAWLKTQPGLPACVQAIESGLEGHLQASELGGSPMAVFVFQGKTDRNAIEACLPSFSASLGFPATLERSDAVTIINRRDGKHTHLGWLKDGSVVWHDDRAAVEEVLKQKSLASSSAPRNKLLAKVDPSRPFWFIAATDMTQRVVDVPSEGLFGSGNLDERALRGSFVFNKPGDAVLAKSRFDQMLVDSRYSSELRRLLAEVKPVLHGREVELNVKPILENPQQMSELLNPSP